MISCSTTTFTKEANVAHSTIGKQDRTPEQTENRNELARYLYAALIGMSASVLEAHFTGDEHLISALFGLVVYTLLSLLNRQVDRIVKAIKSQ